MLLRTEHIVIAFLLLYCSKALADNWTKRSAEYPIFPEIIAGSMKSFKIAGSNCSFTLPKVICPFEYEGEGTCNLNLVLSQLFPNINIEDSTNRFIVPAKFEVGSIELIACPENPKDGTITFVAKSVESVELTPQHLTLGAGTKLRLSWSFITKFDPEKLEVKLKGFTSIGSDTRVELKVEKSTEGSDYLLKFNLGTLNVNNFLAKFGVDASQMITSDLSFASSRMGLATLILQEPNVDGLFSPGGGFEIIATGRISAPELPADASNFYVIVQNFKEGTSDSANEGYGKPIAAIFALYEDERVENTISSLTYMDVPRMAIFKKVDQVAITVATKQIYNINSRTVRDLANKFIPIEGLDMISQGLTVMHYSPNKNPDIKDKNQNTAERTLFRIEVGKDGLTWTSPQRIETQMAKMGSLVWSLRDCHEKFAIPFSTKGVLVNIKYVKEKGQMEVSFNLTERVPVLENGLVSLFNSTITLFSKGKTEGCSWELRGEGRESILEKLVNVTVLNSGHSTTVIGATKIFDMATLVNRTKAKPFNKEYEDAFPFLAALPFHDLDCVASFERRNLLMFRGVALVDGRPKIEIVYSILEGQPHLKLGLHFKGQYLYKVVNMFYGEEKINATWIKFQDICIVAKIQSKQMMFDNPCLAKVDKTFSNAGIGIVAEDLITTDCKGGESRMCTFLGNFIGDIVYNPYIGKMLPKHMTMRMRLDEIIKFNLGKNVFFLELLDYKDRPISTIDSRNGGDLLSLKARVKLPSYERLILATIYDDGAKRIMLKFAFDTKTPTRYVRKILGLSFAYIFPIKSIFELPVSRLIDAVEFQSRLHIGSVHEKQIEFPAKMSREYVGYQYGQHAISLVKFVGERSALQLKRIFDAFDVTDIPELLRNARFYSQLVVGYTSLDEEWNVPEFKVNVKKGLHFYGKLKLKTGEIYDTTVSGLDSMQWRATFHLEPLRYGKITKDSRGRPIFQHVNLFLHKNSTSTVIGPDFVLEGQKRYLKGYAQTVGVQGDFRSEAEHIDGDKFKYEIMLGGSLYNEVDNVEVYLTASSTDGRKDFTFMYELDITPQSKLNVNSKLREVLEDIKKDAKKGRDAANEMANDVASLLDTYKQKRRGYLNEMSSVVDQIHNINKDVDLALIDITTDCINQCKTVAMPGIDWKENCLKGSGEQRNIKCMTWNADKEKVINVICVLKCEAKKMAASAQASANLEEIRVLVNRYREQKVLSENGGKLIQLIEEVDEIAKSAKYLVGNKTNIQDEVKELLTLSGDIVEINSLKVDTNLESISPPCLPFHLDFTLKTRKPSNHRVVHPICFNGEFYKNVGLRIMRMKYSAIDEMYKALEEAELRYARIGGIKKGLSRVEEDISKGSKRDSIPSAIHEDPIERMLTKMAKRRIPTFTLKSDKTVLAFHHYSPWATIKRSDPFEMVPKPSNNVKYNTANLKGKSACQQTKDVIAEYKDISDNLEQLSANYKHGKLMYGKTKKSIKQDLDSSHFEINKLMNETKLYPSEKRDMLFWYQFTKQGMNSYLQTFVDRLAKQNRRSLLHLRDELSSFYGTNDFVRHLGHLGSDAVSRSTVTRPRKNKHIMGLKKFRRELQRALSMNLDEAETVIPKLKDDIQALYYSMASC